MHDANQLVTFDRGRNDPDGHLLDLEHWSPLVARRRAAEQDIVLTEPHWAVIYCLRERYRVRGPAVSARELLRELEAEFAEEGGRRHLYGLFPRGPVLQASPIAGLPLPPGTLDLSFGSSH